MYSMFTYVALSFSFIVLTKLFLQSFFFTSNQNLPPSPPSLPFIGHLHHFSKPLHRALATLSARHGPILYLRFGSRPTLLISSLPLAEECFTTNDVAFANRVHFPSIQTLTYNYTTLSDANYGPHWRNMRRIATVEVLSAQRLETFSQVRSGEVVEMIRRLFQESTKTEGAYTKVELKPRLFQFALNNIMRMIAGDKLRGKSSEEFLKKVEDVVSIAGASNVGDFLPLLGWVDTQGAKKKVMRVHKYMDRFLQGLIDELRHESDNEETREKTMIRVLLLLQKSDPNYYTDQIIKSQIMDLSWPLQAMLVAGADTSLNTMEWAMSLLLNNPDKLKKAKAELDAQIGNGRLIQESDLPNLQYLHCVITETLRHYPAGPLLVPHESQEECVVGGYNIPRGTMLLVNAYAIHRDAKTWEEPEKFVPERFEESKGEGRKMLPFGMGRRRCPGEGLATRMVGLGLGTMIQCFDWKRIGEEEVDMSEGSGLTLPKAHPLQAMYRPSQSMISILSCL
ncbi:isoflavone 3'-hydroxylase [Iris pallida]|uniref:Isoflavone 3'-hydroxylase n=1 Tax=Iris pallida TaxID=29817 RepID=A0AAX6DUE3_IRIPA|nr:isoflavone 3'-hydroxylase [Iris pallida]